MIQGRVQGVGYRFSAQVRARSLGLCGWVRNCPDGSVEAVAEGAQDDLRAFLAWCRQGPPLARVLDVSHSFDNATGRFTSFDVRV